MAVIHHCGEGRVDNFGIGDVFQDVLAWVRQTIADDMWRWYDGHKDDPLVTVGVWFLRYSVRVRHVRPLFETLFGPHP